MAIKRTSELSSIDIPNGGKYTEVKERIKFLAENFAYSISTEFQFIEGLKLWIVTATLTIKEDGEENIYKASAKEYENKIAGDVNNTSALENAETSAVGRACALAGIGITHGIASAEEIKAALAQGATINQKKTVKTVEKEIEEVGTIPEGMIVKPSFNAKDFVIENVKKATTTERVKNLEEAFKKNTTYTAEDRVDIEAEFKRKKETLKKQAQRAKNSKKDAS